MDYGSYRLMTGDPIKRTELIGLIAAAAAHHHTAYLASEGVDPEWPQFYASYLQTRVWDRLGVLLTRSELTHILVGADLAISTGIATGDWKQVYADRIRSFATDKAARTGS